MSTAEMRQVFNLGIGFIAVVPLAWVFRVREAAEQAGVRTWVVGEVRSGARGVRFG